MQQHRNTTTPGFTIVELLIVIVVIGVLAAITIVAFNGIQQRARVATVKADLASAAKQLELTNLNDGAYPADTSSLKASAGTTYQYAYTASTNTYCLTATNGTSTYNVSTTATTPTEGGCAGHGVGGVAAVTNILTNPSLEAGLTNWAANGAGRTLVTSGGHTGASFQRMTFTTTVTTNSGPYSTSGVGSVTAGQAYSGLMWIRSSKAASFIPRFEWKNDAGSSVAASTFGAAVNVAPNTWTPVKISGHVAPANATRITFTSYSTSTTWNAGDTIDGDSAILIQGADVGAYADGDSPNWIWNGTAHSATSTGPAS